MMRTNGHGRPIVAFDLDGTLGNYHKHFLEFAALWLGYEMPDPEGVNPGLPLWKHMGVSQETYRKVKLAFRVGGYKRWMPAYDYVEQLSDLIAGWGADLWICTTRPYLRHDAIDEDTQEWLRRNKVTPDGLIYDEVGRKGSKYAELNRQVGDRVAVIVEDLPEMLDAVNTIILGGGFRYVQLVICRDQPYNRKQSTLSMGATRMDTIHRMMDPIHDAVKRWEMEHGW